MRRHKHYWLETGIAHPLVALNRRFRYDCSVCGKQRFCRNQPVNPLVPSAWAVYEAEVARGNAHLVMSPPLSVGQESQYQEGERYRQLVTAPPKVSNVGDDKGAGK